MSSFQEIYDCFHYLSMIGDNRWWQALQLEHYNEFRTQPNANPELASLAIVAGGFSQEQLPNW